MIKWFNLGFEIGAVTGSQSNHQSEVDDGDTCPVTLSDDTNMYMTTFNKMQESDSSLHALWMEAKQNDSRYCISIDLLDEIISIVDDRILLILPDNIRD